MAGIVLLAAFGLALGYVVLASHTHGFVDAEGVLEAAKRPRHWWMPPLPTLSPVSATDGPG